jgi:hypothetical protein
MARLYALQLTPRELQDLLLRAVARGAAREPAVAHLV